MTADDPQAGKRRMAGVFDRAAKTYDQVGVDFFSSIGRDLVACACIRAGERVLDLGCGRGAVLFPARDAVGETGSVTGVDLSAQMVELTSAEVARRQLSNVTVERRDAERPGLRPGAFDAVLASLVLFFLLDPLAALVRYAELLDDDGGRLGFSTFGDEDPHLDAAMLAVGAFVPGGLPERGARQGPFGSAATIAELLGAAGFSVIDSTARTYESRFSDLDQWVAWLWSHGGRATLERVPEGDLPRALDAASAAFEPARTPSGDYLIRTTIRFTTAAPT